MAESAQYPVFDMFDLELEVGDCIEEHSDAFTNNILEYIVHLDFNQRIARLRGITVFPGDPDTLTFGYLRGNMVRRRCGDPCPRLFECLAEGQEVRLTDVP